MAIVTYNLRDIVGNTMDGREGVVIFTLNAPNVMVGTGGLRPDMSHKSTPTSGGDGSVDLEPTTSMLADAWYTISIMWLQQDLLDSSRGAALQSFLDMQLRVPAAGGRLDQLLTVGGGNGGGGGGPNGRIVWVSQTPPSSPRPWMLWLEQEPGPTPDPFDPRNTSILHEWRP